MKRSPRLRAGIVIGIVVTTIMAILGIRSLLYNVNHVWFETQAYGKPLIEWYRLLKSDDPGIRLEASHVVATFYFKYLVPEDAIDTLASCLADDDPEIRRNCLVALAGYGRNSFRVINSIRPLLQDKNPEVAGQAKKTLQTVSDAQHSAGQ